MQLSKKNLMDWLNRRVYRFMKFTYLINFYISLINIRDMTILLSSSFLPPNHVSSSSTYRNRIYHHHSIVITAKSSFTTFHYPKSKPTNQTFDQTIKNPQPSQKPLLATIFNKLDNFICDFIDLPLHPSVDPKLVLSGNFAPVDELPPTACDSVEGSLPSCLDGGAYIRNGPNPNFIPRGPYHLFEGDGMLHMIKFSHGKNPTFCCRYVNTHKHTVEREMGYPFVPSIFSSFNGGLLASISRFLLTSARILAGYFDPINHGFGAANTNLALFSGHLFALCESDLPYAVNITAEGDITTLGRHDFGASEPFHRMTAHPKVDGVTGEAFAYEYDGVPPYLTYFRINSDGRKQKSVPIFSVERPMAIHDFAVTEKYAVIPDMQIVVNPVSILRGRSPVGIDREKVSRLGIIPRYAEDEVEMVWVEAAGVNPLHCVNAWDEDGGDTVCMVATNSLAVERLMEDIDCAEMRMEKIVVNVKAKTVKRLPLCPEFLDLAIINPAYAAKKNRYIYAVILGEKRSVGLVKLDLTLLNEEVGGDCTVASRRFEAGCHGGEPYFVAREGAEEEDDGYLVAYFHYGNSDESKFVVMDAKSPTLEIIAAVKLPQRMPMGFHGLFLSETQLTSLKSSNYA